MSLIVKLQRVIMFISSLLLVIGLSLAVLLRYVLKMDLYGIEELLIIPMFLVYFMGAAYGSYENSHISADIAESFIKSKKFILWLRIITSIVTLITLFVITFWNIEYFVWSIDNGGKTTGWQIPLFIPYGVVLLGFLLMCLYTFIHTYRQIREIIKQG